MYSKIMVPVDLAHLEVLQPALKTASDLARHYGAEVCYVGVTATTPGSVARTPEEYQQKLEAFAREQAGDHGQRASARTITSPDPIADLDDVLLQAIEDTGADLVVMATHLPRHLDAVMPSHGDRIAAHTEQSVFLVRVHNRDG
ncbi:universal stress protein [Arhodomonas aquaeolei]|uniref:universal stress protein n=1 Tax=Arhodomonas aquaeolei TaxID=2369 RepID=UPI00216798A5|nr:universal stress protein [Arhodomonas aquaeolei]MCS4504433.1 universal stress protein [Arhodomonas aquaeolei]